MAAGQWDSSHGKNLQYASSAFRLWGPFFEANVRFGGSHETGPRNLFNLFLDSRVDSDPIVQPDMPDSGPFADAPANRYNGPNGSIHRLSGFISPFAYPSRRLADFIMVYTAENTNS